MRDRRISLRLITDVLEVLHRHGFTRGDDEHVGRAGFLIGDLARIYEGSQDRPFGSSTTEPSYLPAPPGPPGPEDDLDAVTLTHAEVRTVLTSLDLAGDWKRDRAQTCADCPDQTCFACQLRLHEARACDQLAVQLLRDEQAARTARRQARPRAPQSQPGLAAGKQAGQ
jgi:hypothetical protein